ncbi:TIGR04282 family arsenosugar biosynthesis glycosyltransferase [Hymenobacter perfusus]|uniref:TIGR04282 family arsenosugar biosynthesis glycosyltransferase n=1 Tax=Hymenobacter perfusus TaxID=1236770 RepID=UPI001476E637|nr:DUF2064 domain-containing protein [Hymenobacter perfusus]
MISAAAPVAILLFARSAGQEAAHKRFVSHGKAGANVRAAAQLTAHAAATARQLGVDFLHVDSRQQRGRTFGERLAGAMQQAFAAGYEHLLVIGNDCPQLNLLLLRQALAALQKNGSVIGPATDGGVYLLGVARTRFDPDTWATLPWQTASLGKVLAAELARTGVKHGPGLPALPDVDNEQDLARVLRQALPRRLQRALRQLRQTPIPAYRPRPTAPEAAWRAAHPHRGPPGS